MKTNILIYLTIIASLISCKQKLKENVIPVIDYTKFIHRDVRLSEFGDDISYIKLSSEITIQSIRDIEVSDSNQIYISIWKPSQIAEYDFSGNLIRKIGSKGKGPGEYLYCNNLTLDNANQRMYVLSLNDILTYSLDGSFIDKKDITSYDHIDLGFDNIGYKEDEIYLFQDVSYGDGEYQWLRLNLKTGGHLEKLNLFKHFESEVGSSGNLVYEYNNHFCYWNHLNDTIFEIFPDNSYKARYLFTKNDKRLSSKNFNGDFFNDLSLRTYDNK